MKEPSITGAPAAEAAEVAGVYGTVCGGAMGPMGKTTSFFAYSSKGDEMSSTLLELILLLRVAEAAGTRASANDNARLGDAVVAGGGVVVN